MVPRNGRLKRLAVRLGVAAVVASALLRLSTVADSVGTGGPQVGAGSQPTPELGLSINEPRAYRGYTLFAPMRSEKTYLLDMDGKVVKTWQSDAPPALGAYLLENGHLFRPAVIRDQPFGDGAGAGGRIQEFDWDGNLVWDFKFADENHLPHHDAIKLPNGNALMIVWERKTPEEALAAGRRPDLVGDRPLQPDCLIEVQPTGPTTGEVVWEWHLWDHLVQDHDPARANYGPVGEHPELVDVNFDEGAMADLVATKDGVDKLRSLGYLGGTPAGAAPRRVDPDWTHFNSIDYNPELDQIAISVHGFSEVWVIDHSTTTAEAAGHTGGRSGQGGDLLYRWGNPVAYRAGTAADQQLFHQHHAHWIPEGRPGAGHILVFNNGMERPGGEYSSVEEIAPPVDAEGRYRRVAGKPFGPERPVWSYAAPEKTDFYSMLISGAQRLPNGDTLICSGNNGTLFEVTPGGEIVWKYVNPIQDGGAPPGRPGGSSRLVGVLSIVRNWLGVSRDRRKDADETRESTLDDEMGRFGQRRGQLMSLSAPITPRPTPEPKAKAEPPSTANLARLATLVSDDPKSRTRPRRDDDARGVPGGEPGGSPGPSDVLPAPQRDRLRLTRDQREVLDALQAEVNATLVATLDDGQLARLRERGRFNAPGQLMALSTEIILKLTPEQRATIAALQEASDATLASLLNDPQASRFRRLCDAFVRGVPGGLDRGAPGARSGGGPVRLAGVPPARPADAPRRNDSARQVDPSTGGPPVAGPGAPPDSGPVGLGGPGKASGPGGFLGGPPREGGVFRAYRYAPNYPGLAGKALRPGKTIEELHPEDEAAE